MNNKKTQYINLNSARLDEQTEVMEEIQADGACPFCQENLQRYHKKPILKNGKFWTVTYNQWPYENTKIHLLLIYKEHAVKLSELDPAAGSELIQIVQEFEKENNIAGGGVIIRFGDTDHSAGSVNHLHAQLIVPNIDNKNFIPVRVKLGLEWEKRQ